MIDSQPFTVRPMARAEVDLAVDWAEQEGWNPGLHDAGCFDAAEPGGFLVGLVGDAPVACISAVKYGVSFGFLGFYIVKPAWRARGYGRQIWNAGMQRLHGRAIGLDGVLAQQDNYRRSGFTLAHRNIRYRGQGGAEAPADGQIVPLHTLPFESVATYDRPFFPDDRSRFLRHWIGQARATALGLLEHRRLVGYGVVRPCRSGHKIGPLLADSPEAAERLFTALQAHVPAGQPVYLDTPEPNAAALALARRHAMAPEFETARMYTRPCAAPPMERWFGVTSFELG